jgi:hypothetical protein
MLAGLLHNVIQVQQLYAFSVSYLSSTEHNKTDKSSLTLYRELNFSWGKKLYIECCSRKEMSGIAWLIAGIRQLEGVRRNADKGRCPLCLEEDVKHILLECKETKHWREKLIHDKW